MQKQKQNRFLFNRVNKTIYSKNTRSFKHPLSFFIFFFNWDRCYDFLKYFRRKKLAFLTRNKAKLCKNVIKTLVFEKNANFFVENLIKL
jgi:hypothetical protein